MTTIEVGKKAPDFKLPASNGETVKLSDYRGKKVVLYFYPKDNTPTCTQQACDFRDAYPAMADSNTVVLGISPDPVKSHEKFIGKQSLPFLLLSDENHKVCEKYGVWQMKKLYGREYMGVVRSTFLINEKGKLVREWRGVKIKGHVQQVADEAAKL
ncbi:MULTISPECIES: thioredoxin-dependent thiol peroxidase [unclassified Paenibacillus]|uniref:thioredoxin-dependent thiol peroxidase n=1 Tax=unclassified Paenibacillus TaxID=185978 RepID=UPI0010444BE6|nr:MULTISPECIES: thioredoxin-dependent thiol peroxidase [unclassified Paenibacillus]NIK69594.1 peroxiredoxin Q/BCP [Paenibacillus sp. BK720]TCM95770.1 peroxiredoxin Q/BCP [Paenibacillus sp. BK033]